MSAVWGGRGYKLRRRVTLLGKEDKGVLRGVGPEATR